MLFGIKHDLEHSNFNTFQALSAVTTRQNLPHESPSTTNMQPILEFTAEKNGCFLIPTQSALADTEDLLRWRNDAEGAGKSRAPHTSTPFSGSFFTHAVGHLMRVVELCFLSTAAHYGSASQSQYLQQVIVQS